VGGGPAGRRVHPTGVGAFAGAVTRRGAGAPEESAYRSPLLDEIPGAVPATDHDTGIALHYGDSAGEQQALTTDAGFVDRSNRMVLMVTGTDRLA
jgi:tRNA-modifying protein YgfZ